MDKKKLNSLARFRGFIQAGATLLTNIHLPNFAKGTLYQGNGKYVCVPGLNCYSCPGAAGACPVGAFQAVVGSSKFRFSYYITGILILFGVLLGRFICGFLCPFGWFQELLHKIPSPKLSTKKLKPLRYLKYAVLLVMVVLLPLLAVNELGMGDPFFCKYLCPQGVLEGAIPLSLTNAGIRAALGKLFTWKACILLAVIVGSVVFYRPFCKWLCPLGAFYALLNKVSLFQMRVDTHKCVSCGACAKACKMDVDITKTPNHAECIRCGMCMKACPTDAIQYKFGLGTNQIPKQQRSKAMKIHRIAALFLSLVLAFSLAACGQGASSASSASSSAASSAAAESKTEEQLLAEENEILSANDALWEKVFSSMDKNVTETTISANYGDFLLSAVEKAKDQFSDEEYKTLTADAEKIRAIEEQIAALAPAEDAASSAAAQGTAFPKFEGSDLEGNPVDNSLFAGNAFTVVNFWFNGCKPCVEELDDLNALNEKVKAQGGEVVGINTETLDGNQQGIDAAKKLLETTGASYRNIYFASGSEAGKFALNIMAFPTTYVFDRDGNVVGQPLLGGIDKEENLAALQKNIDAALAKDSAK